LSGKARENLQEKKSLALFSLTLTIRILITPIKVD
jgi:hypothetical protein